MPPLRRHNQAHNDRTRTNGLYDLTLRATGSRRRDARRAAYLVNCTRNERELDRPVPSRTVSVTGTTLAETGTTGTGPLMRSTLTDGSRRGTRCRRRDRNPGDDGWLSDRARRLQGGEASSKWEAQAPGTWKLIVTGAAEP